ncbi:MAG: BACON domain-containing protein, partial [Prevotella sp.]|nr:BACON domain-containing protein [Prevotella sp.]
MKLRYFLGAFLSALLFVGCSDDDEVGQLGSIQLDQTYVSIPETGGDATVTIKAAAPWAFDKTYQVITKHDDGTRDTTYNALPAWLTADKLSGEAGETKVTLHADATNGGREAELRITMGDERQFLLVRQGSMEAATATCAEVLAAPDGKTFRVKGTCTAIANTTYGNWYLSDATGQVYIYGTLDKDGKTKNFSSLGIEVGDVIEVEGPKTTYNGTVELVDVTVISITKSLIKVVSEPVTVQKEGGDVEVKVAYKGSGAFFNIADDAKSWVSFLDSKFVAGKKTLFEQNPADTAIFKFRVAPNENEGRKANIEFTSSTGSNNSSVVYTISQEANILPHGMNPDDPYTVAEAIAKCKEIGTTASEELYYAKGIISSIKSIDTGSYGNAEFKISDDGTDENTVTCYRAYSLNNQKFTSTDEIGVGDEVIIVGKLVNYKGETPEFAQGCYIYARKSAEEANKPGSLLNPFTPAQAKAFVAAMEAGVESTEDYYIKGRIIEITDKNQFGTQYGNCTFYLSDDGTDKDDKFYIFRTLYLGNVKYSDDSWLKPQAGDEVVICGKVVNYKGETPETAANKSYIYSLNG